MKALLKKSIYPIQLIFMLSLLFAFQSCGDDDSGDVINEVPEEVFDLLPEELYNQLVENGFIFNLGDTPPSIEGIYLLEPENQYDNSGLFSPGSSALDARLKFENQINDQLDVLIKNWTGIGQVDTSDATIITGEGNRFTVVAQANGAVGENTYKYDYAITGILSDDGIEEAQLAFIMVENNNASGVATTGTIRIFKDEDNLAANTDTFKMSNPIKSNKPMLSK